MKHAPETFEEALNYVLDDLRELMIRKQRDYGPRNILDSGKIGLAIRMNDKVRRIHNLLGIQDGTFKPKDASNESVLDSFKDLANYGIIAVMADRNWFDLPLCRAKPDTIADELQYEGPMGYDHSRETPDDVVRRDAANDDHLRGQYRRHTKPNGCAHHIVKKSGCPGCFPAPKFGEQVQD